MTFYEVTGALVILQHCPHTRLPRDRIQLVKTASRLGLKIPHLLVLHLEMKHGLSTVALAFLDLPSQLEPLNT
jgi:phage-related holin